MYKIVHDIDENKFKAIENGTSVAHIDYYEDLGNNTIAVTHTEVDPQFEGQGIAGAMTKEILEYIKQKGLKINPICSYTKTYIGRHPEYKHLQTDASK